MNQQKVIRMAVFLGSFMIVFSGQLELARAVSEMRAIPAELTPASQAEVRQILRDLEKKMRQIENVQTKFFQTKQMSLFQHEVKLHGSLAMEKPNRFAWRTESPRESSPGRATCRPA